MRRWRPWINRRPRTASVDVPKAFVADGHRFRLRQELVGKSSITHCSSDHKSRINRRQPADNPPIICVFLVGSSRLGVAFAPQRCFGSPRFWLSSVLVIQGGTLIFSGGRSVLRPVPAPTHKPTCTRAGKTARADRPGMRTVGRRAWPLISLGSVRPGKWTR